MNKQFKVGDFPFELSWPEGILPPEHFLRFETEQIHPEISYRILLAEQLPVIHDGTILAKRPDLTVYQTKHGECRRIGIKGRQECYGFYQEISKSHADIFLKTDQLKELNIDPVFTSLLALERQMIRHNSLILHCAYIRYQGKAILFSAPSGTGKTTQANLWETYMGSATINGDRSLLRKQNGQWIAEGWPVCGTSEICWNQDTPIQSIIVLRQSKENTIRKLSAFEAFTKLYAQITVNSWNRPAVEHSMQLLEELLGTIPVYELACTISKEAVDCLATELERDC